MLTMTSDLKYVLVAALFVVLAVAAYGLRLAVKGPVHFDRIDRQGSSGLLNKGAMELCYWCLEPLAKLMVFLRIRPNMVSWTSLPLGVLAGACLAAGHFGFGAIFATVCGLLDCLDGMIARISGVASDAGEVLDAAVDRYVDFFFLSGLVIYYRSIPILQILALLALLGSFMVSYSTAKAEALQVDVARGSMRRPERCLYLALGAALSAATIPWFETPGKFFVPVGYPMVLALGLVAAVGNFSSIERLWSIAKTARLRERDPVEARTRAAQKEPAEAQEASHQASHRAFDIRL